MMSTTIQEPVKHNGISKRTDRINLSSNLFEARNSLLTDLYQNTHIATIYHICIATLFGLFVNTAVHDYLFEGKAGLGLNLILKGFSKFHLITVIWICMFVASTVLYFSFKFWAIKRVELKPKSYELKLWDMLWFGLYIFFYPSFMYVVTVAVIKNEIPIAGSIAITCELTRFLMKSHAFVRSNTPRVLKYKLNVDDQILCPNLSTFFYFSFAPTLVYQDSYPRSNHIRWNYVSSYLAQFVGALFFYSFLLETFIIPSYKDYGFKPFTWKDIIVLTFRNVAPSMGILLNTFYVIIHVWQNMFAELLTFSDRMFYKDWWTSTTQERYHRTWNLLVQNWLSIYVYKDFYEYVAPKKEHLAKYVELFLVGIFHDFILGVAFRSWLPIFLVEFLVVGVPLRYMKIKPDYFGNAFLWYSLALGTSLNVVVYSLEYYARVNCPVENAKLLTYFVPHMFSCN